MSLRARTSLAAVGVVLIVLAVLVPTVTAILRHSLGDALDQRLAEQASYATGPAAGKLLKNYPGVGFEQRIPGTLFQVLDSDGRPIPGSTNPEPIAGKVAVPVAQGRAGPTYVSVHLQDMPVRTLTAPVNVIGFGRVGAVSVGLVDATEATVGRVRRLLIGAGLLALALAAGLAWVVGRAATRPVTRISAAARAVADSGDPSRRVAPAGRDEVGDLARTFNQMLSRLEAVQGELAGALDSQRRFMAEASHQLRTPLTSLRGNLDILARNPGMPAGEQAAAVAELRAEAERMSRLVDGLLHLARGEAPSRDGAAAVDLVDLVAIEVARVRRVASGHEIRLELPDRPVLVAAHDDLVDRALGNLIDNAVVHGGRHVVVAVAVADGGAVVRVRDDGRGIAAEELPHVFERFWRGPSARGRSGTGLGLAIAAAAAMAMDGELTVDSRPGETTFQLRISLAPAGPDQPSARGQAAARTTF
jgi:two-component system sensor histidine kinase MprB